MLRRVRTSSGTFLSREHDDVVTRIEERIARFTKIPAENGEALQILHYGGDFLPPPVVASAQRTCQGGLPYAVCSAGYSR